MSKKKYQPKPPPPLVPHSPYSYGEKRVAIVRIPAGTPEPEKRKARAANIQLARSLSTPYVYDDEIYL